MKKGKLLRTGLIGLWGHTVYGTGLLDHEQTEAAAISCWGQEEQNTSICEEAALRGINSYEDPLEMLAKEQLDAVAILAPPAVIPSLVSAAAGKVGCILLEKPVAKDLTGLKELQQAVQNHSVMLSAAYPTRNYLQFKQVKAAVDEGKIGKILTCSYTYLQTGGPLYTVDTCSENLALVAGGDDTMFLGYAVMDIMYLCGCRISELFARGGAYFYENYKKAGINDLSHINYRSESGVCGSISVGRIPVQGKQALHHLQITGEKGMIRCDFNKHKMVARMTGKAQEMSFPQSPFNCLIDDFVKAGLGQKKAHFSLDEICHSIEVQEAVKASVIKNQPIKIEPLT